MARPLQKRSRNRGWLCPSSGDEAAMPPRHSGIPCSWQALVSSDDDNATCPIIRQPAPPGQRPPEGSHHDNDACPIIRQAALARQTPGGSYHWAESESDVETLAPPRHSSVPWPNYTTSKLDPSEPTLIDINVEMLKVCVGRGAIKIRYNLAINNTNGMSRTRVNAVLCRPCPACAKNCYAKIRIQDLLEVCTWWHGHMTAGEAACLLNFQYRGNPSREDTIAERTHWHLCGVRMCYYAVCSPLGTSRRTGRKYSHGVVEEQGKVNIEIERSKLTREKTPAASVNRATYTISPKKKCGLRPKSQSRSRIEGPVTAAVVKGSQYGEFVMRLKFVAGQMTILPGRPALFLKSIAIPPGSPLEACSAARGQHGRVWLFSVLVTHHQECQFCHQTYMRRP